MALARVFRRVKRTTPQRDESGIALFLVIGSMSILSILATEFTYLAQMNQGIAFDGVDQVKAHYVAKSGFKLSLLRLKAYMQVKKTISSLGGGAANAVPKQILEKIWSFPFLYPIPKELPGLTLVQKDAIEKFEKASGLEGSFSALIESESNRLNLNSIVAGFQAPTASPSPGASPSPTPTASSSPFNAVKAREALAEYFFRVLDTKFIADPDFAAENRDFRLEDFMDSLVGWIDRTYEPRNIGGKDDLPLKRAPVYSISELRMLPTLTDELYNLFAPTLTATRTTGLNINFINESTLRALVPNLLNEEVKLFFEYRDSQEADNFFKTPEDFFTYASENFSYFRNSPATIEAFKTGLTQRGIRLVTEESQFKITVRAQVNQAVRIYEAWVTLSDPSRSPTTPVAPGGGSVPGSSVGASPGIGLGPAVNDSGLKITFMRLY